MPLINIEIIDMRADEVDRHAVDCRRCQGAGTAALRDSSQLSDGPRGGNHVYH